MDHGLIWLNLVVLLTMSFMPFPTAIFVLSVGAALFGLVAAVLFWLVLLPVGRTLLVRALSRRWEQQSGCSIRGWNG